MLKDECKKNFFINTCTKSKIRNTNKIIRNELYKNQKTDNTTTNSVLEIFKGELITLEPGMILNNF